MINIIIGSILTVLSVLIGGIITYYILKTSGYMPIKGQRWSDKDPIENPFELIIKAMRKDISNNQRKINEFEFTNFFFKASS